MLLLWSTLITTIHLDTLLTIWYCWQTSFKHHVDVTSAQYMLLILYARLTLLDYPQPQPNPNLIYCAWHYWLTYNSWFPCGYIHLNSSNQIPWLPTLSQFFYWKNFTTLISSSQLLSLDTLTKVQLHLWHRKTFGTMLLTQLWPPASF